MLIPVLSWVSNSKTGSIITVKDTTGAYNVDDNPGGYGTPNQATPPSMVGFRWRYWPDDVDYANFISSDSTFITALLAAGKPFTTTDLGLPEGLFSSGVHNIKYYPLASSAGTITLTNGSKTATYTSGTTSALTSTVKGAVFLQSSVAKTAVLLIDQSRTMTSTVFYLTDVFLGTTGSYNIYIAAEADLKVFLKEPAENCLVSKIGTIAEKQSGCEKSFIDDTLLMTQWAFAAKRKFDCLDYQGAHNMLVGIEKKCNPCYTVSSCQTCS